MANVMKILLCSDVNKSIVEAALVQAAIPGCGIENFGISLNTAANGMGDQWWGGSGSYPQEMIDVLSAVPECEMYPQTPRGAAAVFAGTIATHSPTLYMV